MDDTKNKASELEALISSVLTSNPLRMTIRDLDRQFKELNGYRIPFAELGFGSLESYLQSIPHCLIVNGRGYDAELCLKVSQKTAHIESLIRKQKPPKKKLRPSHQNRRGNFHNQTYPSPQIQRPVPFIQNRRSEEFNFKKKTDNNQNVPPTIQNNTIPNTQHIPSLINLNLRRPKEIVENVSSTSQIKENPVMAIETNSNITPTTSTSKGVIPKNHVNNNHNSTPLKNNVPYYVQNRLKELIRSYPEGLHSGKLTEAYKKRFKHCLDYSDYGYKSITHFCLDFKTIFAFKHLKDGNFQLYDKELNLPLEHEPEKDEKEMDQKQFDTINWKKIQQNKDPPLPDDIEDVLLEFHLKQLLSNVVYDANIIRQWIETDVALFDFIDIEVAEVYDPSKFWIHLRQHSDSLNQLMDNMQIFYSGNKDKYYIPHYAIREGMYLASIFDGEYHRAKVVDCSKKMEGSIKVFYIDYGTIAVVRIKTVYYLTSDFVSFPAQAIRARLYGIQPPVLNELWSQQASSRFLQLVRHKSLVAQIYDIDEKDMILDLIVVDTSTPGRDIFINDLLIQEQLASFSNEEPNEKSTNDCTPTVPNVYLYPTHEEFESGTTLTYGAMLHLQACNFSYDRIFPKYFQKIENVGNKAEDGELSDEEIVCEDDFEENDSEIIKNVSNDEEILDNSEIIKNDSDNNTEIVDNNSEEIVENELVVSTTENIPVITTERRRTLRPPPGFSNFLPNQFGVDPNYTQSMFFAAMNTCMMMNTPPYNCYYPYEPQIPHQFCHPSQNVPHYIPPYLNHPPMIPHPNYYNPPYHFNQMNHFYPPNYQQYHGNCNSNHSPNKKNSPDLSSPRKCESRNDEIKTSSMPKMRDKRDGNKNFNFNDDGIIDSGGNGPQKQQKSSFKSTKFEGKDRNGSVIKKVNDSLKFGDKNISGDCENLCLEGSNNVVIQKVDEFENKSSRLEASNNVFSENYNNSYLESSKNVVDEFENKTFSGNESNNIPQTVMIEDNEKKLFNDSCVEHITNSFKSLECNDVNQSNKNERNLNEEDDNDINLAEVTSEKRSIKSSLGDSNENIITKLFDNEIEEKKMIESECRNLNILNTANDGYKSALENEIKITFHDFGSASLHIVTDTDDKYIILQEFRKELLNSFPLELILRAIATAPVLINMDNILLDEIPSDLKADLLQKNIITSICNKIDIFPVNQIRDVFKALYGNVSIKPEHDIFLKEFECYFINNNYAPD